MNKSKRKNHRRPSKSSFALSSIEFNSKSIMQIDDDSEGVGLAEAHGGDDTLLIPLFSISRLNLYPYKNDTLLQCISAMVANISSTSETIFIDADLIMGKEEGANLENELLSDIKKNCSGKKTLTKVREIYRNHLETFGFAFVEIVRDGVGTTAIIHNVSPLITRIIDAKEETLVTEYVHRKGERVGIERTRTFYKFIQRNNKGDIRYFKEFGDPRGMESTTGKFLSGGVKGDATEIAMSSLCENGSPYGFPRWINQLPSVIGSRKAENVNVVFFDSNAIPDMVVLVSGGSLSDDSFNEIEEKLTSNKGADSLNNIIVLEAYGDEEASDDNGKIPPPKIEIKPLSDSRQSDQLFGKYIDKCTKSIRRSFRLPPILLGAAGADYNRATAEASIKLAESQVFHSARKEEIDFFNGLIQIEYKPLRYAKYIGNTPANTNIIEISKILEKIGHKMGLSEKEYRTILNDALSTNIFTRCKVQT